MDIQWALVLFTLFGGCGAGLLVFTTLFALIGQPARRRRIYTVVSLVLVALGGGFSVLHLAQKAHIMAAAQNLGSLSGISLEMIFLAFTGIFGIIYFVVARGDKPGIAERIFAALTLLSALIFCVVTGSGYIIEARAAWNTAMLPVAYFGSDIAMGACLYAFLEGRQEMSDGIRITLVLCAALGALAILLYLCVKSLFSLATVWAIVAVAGAVAGTVCCILYWRADQHNRLWALIGFVCFVLAALALRLAMWVAGVGIMEAFSVNYPGVFVFE